MSSSKYLFNGKDITCVRGGRVLFKDLSCRLEEGNVLHIMGENGSGKTSFLRIVAGALPAYEGTAEVADEVAFIPASDAHLKLSETPLEHLRFWAAVYNVRDKVCSSALKKMELGKLKNTPIRYLSSGQRRRLTLAQLFLRKSLLWLLDEPLNGLDKDARKLFLNHIKDHVKEGGSVMVASHEDIPSTKTLKIGGKK